MTWNGIGSVVFYDVLAVMRDKGYKYAFVDSGLSQVDAIGIYERFGCSIQRSRKVWIKIMK